MGDPYEEFYKMMMFSRELSVPFARGQIYGYFGNLIALPLQKLAREEGSSVFVDENFVPYHDQWEYLSSIKKIKLSKLETYILKLLIALAAFVLNSIVNSNRPDVVQRHWAGDGDVLVVIKQIIGVADKMVGSGLWEN